MWISLIILHVDTFAAGLKGVVVENAPIGKKGVHFEEVVEGDLAHFEVVRVALNLVVNSFNLVLVLLVFRVAHNDRF